MTPCKSYTHIDAHIERGVHAKMHLEHIQSWLGVFLSLAMFSYKMLF